MEEKQLDFNAPLLSVRRHAAAAATASASALRSSGREWRSGAASERNLSPPVYKTELKSGPVRDSGAVPFVWEQIPGRPKVTSIHGSSSPKQPAPAPRLPPGKLAAKRENASTAEQEASPAPARSLPPGKVVDSRKEILRTAEGDGRQIEKVGKSSNDRTVQSVRPVGGAHDSVPDSAAKAHGSYGSKEEREKLDGDDCDAFSDALETFSLAETSLFNGSVGGVSALDGQEWKGTGNSSDVQGRSFMMDRFLPAAKAMASETPKYAPRRQLPASEPAKLVNRVQNDAQPLRSQPRPCFIPQYALPDEEEDDESEEEDEEDDDDAGNAVSRACGVFPWSLKTSLCLTNPIFRAQRMRNKNTSSTFVTRKSNKPTKSNDSASSFSGSDEMTWEAVYRNKLVGRVQNLGLHGSGSKLSESSSSPSVYEDTANNQLISYSDSQTPNGSSSFRHSPRGISPYRNEASTSPFSERSGFLGLPKSGRSYGSDSSDANSKGLQARKNTSYLRSKGRSKGISGSLSSTVEKPLYVDPACVGDASNSKSDMLEAKELNQSVDMEASTPVEDQQKQGEPILDSFVITQQSALHVSDVGKIGNVVNLNAAKHHSGLLADIRLLSYADTSENNTGNRVASVVNLAQGVDTLDMSSKVSMLREQMPVGEHVSGEQVSSRSEYSREQNSGNRSASDSEGNSPLLHSLPPLPSPKSPSESWLVRALPGFSAKGSSSSFPQYRLKKSAAKASEPNWEIIIKSTNVDHGHLRYSEELSQTTPRQTENEDA
ncbi:hypothetical protein EJ110_NYTH12723 [Nymphaea thermarum]|nr:hypothetical protein EJ110_NYTH12723 [Nymphaea thermarum]